MSDCVVRMEMPQNCYNCDLRYECNAFYASGKPKPFMKGCMIVCQLPEGHGRLVDISPLDVMVFRDRDYSYYAGALSVCEQIDKLPTIVPAETERSET